MLPRARAACYAAAMRRRVFVSLLAAAGAARAQPALLHKPIPSSGERIPVLGLGSWITFNVGRDGAARAECVQVMRHFFELGGRMVDSSPMYGSSQGVIGDGISQLRAAQRVLSADKVWTSGDGVSQIEQSRREWKVAKFDLLQVHNLVAWEKQLALLQAMKARGDLRYVGITTSEGRRHTEFERIMRSQPLDFVQLSYNVVDREVERTLLPLARERGIAVIVNRPFQEGALLKQLQRHRLPDFAREIGCASWAQFALKFVVSHPAATCAIPATSQVTHVRENMAAGTGPMPDEAMRARMAAHVAAL